MKSVKNFIIERLHSTESNGSLHGEHGTFTEYKDDVPCSGGSNCSDLDIGAYNHNKNATDKKLLQQQQQEQQQRNQKFSDVLNDMSSSLSLSLPLSRNEDLAKNAKITLIDASTTPTTIATAPAATTSSMSAMSMSMAMPPSKCLSLRPMGTTTSLVPSKPFKGSGHSFRKISLPLWNRQTSITKRLNLSRQHTIDTAESYYYNKWQDNKYDVAQVGAHEVTWIIADYIATPGTNELTVTKGQQVEIIEPLTITENDFCLVRLNVNCDEATPATTTIGANNTTPNTSNTSTVTTVATISMQEGLVPISILKPTPQQQSVPAIAATQKSYNAMNVKDKNDTAAATSTTTNEHLQNRTHKLDPLTSSTKRRGLGGRKWLPQIGRKPTQQKLDKPASSSGDKNLVKKTSEKNFKLPTKQLILDGNVISSSNTHIIPSPSSSNDPTQNVQYQQQDFDGDEEVGLVELPPPMKPIQEPHIKVNGGQQTLTKDMKELASVTSSNAGKMNCLSEIEQIVKEKTEKHEEKLKKLNNINNRTLCGGGGATPTATYEYNTNSDVIDNGGNNLEVTCLGKISRENSQDTNTSFQYETTINKMDENRNKFPALTELITTEELYIKDLGEIVNGYMAELKNIESDIIMPNDLKGLKWLIVFANIEAIYEWHRDCFLKALLHCQKQPTDLGVMIKRYENKFQMYITYCNNKPKSEHIVNEHNQYFDQVRQKLGHRLDLSDLLIKPVQRLTKYVLLLNTITKQIEQAGLITEMPSMKEACNVMNAICKNVNDTMVLQRLKNFDGSLTAQGKLLLHGPLSCIENARTAMERKQREMHAFIFEQSIIFTEKHNSKSHFTSPTYMYRLHIQINKMQLEELPNNRFLLKSTDPNRSDLNMICYATTIDSHREWLETIRKLLQIQHDFLNALTRPIAYQQQQQSKNKQHQQHHHHQHQQQQQQLKE